MGAGKVPWRAGDLAETAGPRVRAPAGTRRPGTHVQDIYEELFELAPDAYLFTTASGRILRANRAAQALLKVPRPQLLRAAFSSFMPAADYRRVLHMLPAGHSHPPAQAECEIQLQPRPSQPPLQVAVTIGVARDGTGRRIGLRWLLRDVTERRRVQARLEASLREKELLLREVYHRVKNNLQVMSSLLSLQEGSLSDPAALPVLRTARDRIRSMALVHERLYQTADLSRVDFSDYLRQLAADLTRSFGVSPDHIQFVFQLENLCLGIDVAIPCSMIVHELVTNALRHAFPGGKGTITLTLEAEGSQHVCLVVADDGVGLPVPGPVGGIGLDLVNLMVEQIGGELQTCGGPGAAFRLRFPAGTERWSA